MLGAPVAFVPPMGKSPPPDELQIPESVRQASPLLRALIDQVTQVGPTPWPVLITGETGVGKTVLANLVHAASGRSGELVALNCAALAPTLLESELFGYNRGAFTGADRDTPGLFEAANGGTLFLDEIGDMALEAQARLLRVIEEGLVRRLGSDRELEVDVRIIAATHRVLPDLIADGQFRQDLFFRINSFVLDLPPLRQRRDEIPAWAREFAARLAGGPFEVADDAIAVLRDHTWPGNLRELQSVLRQAGVRAGSDRLIRAAHLPALAFPVVTPTAMVSSGTGTVPPVATTSSLELDVLSQLLRTALAEGGSDTVSWARFLLAWCELQGTNVITRKPFVRVLRRVRGPEPSDNVLEIEWKREHRSRMFATGLVNRDGHRFLVDVSDCRAVIARQTENPDRSRLDASSNLARVSALLAAAPVPAERRASDRSNLPQRELRLIGRDRELGELVETVSAGRGLVTLTGPGGVGKTSLATAVGQRCLPVFDGRVWLVDLREARSASDIVREVGATVGVPPVRENPNEQLVAALATRPGASLLILDNFEHLTEHALATVGEWVHEVPDITFLVTSRALLGIADEQRFVLSPLGVPPADHPPPLIDPDWLESFEGVRLFVVRAREARTDFRLTAENAQAVMQVCSGLDGLPLALELAAARLRTLSPQQLAERLDQKFRLLRSSRRDQPAHQQTLLDTLDWSHELLTPDQQEVLRRVSVFHGSFSLEAAEALLEGDNDGDGGFDLIDALQGLVENSLVTLHESPAGVRYHCSQVVTEYGRSRLDDDLRTRLTARHAEVFRQQAAAWPTGLPGTLEEPSAAALEAYRVDRDNFLEAVAHTLDHATAGRPADGVMAVIAAAIATGDRRHALEFLERLLEPAVAAAADDPATLATISCALARARAVTLDPLGEDTDWTHRDSTVAEPLERAMAGLETATDNASRLLHATAMYWHTIFDDPDSSSSRPADTLADALATFRELKHDQGVILCLSELARRHAFDTERAIGFLREADELSRRSDRQRQREQVLGLRATLEAEAGRYAEADRLLVALAELGDEQPDAPVARARWQWLRARFAIETGDTKLATRLLDDAEGVYRSIGHIDMIAAVLWLRGRTLLAGDDATGALALFDRVLDIVDAVPNRYLRAHARADRGRALLALQRFEAAIPELEFALARQPGDRRRVILDAALATALTATGDPAGAERAIADARLLMDDRDFTGRAEPALQAALAIVRGEQ